MQTTNKESKLKKLLIKCTVVVVAISGVLLGAGFVLSNYSDDLVGTQSTKQNENSMVNSQYNEFVADLGAENEVGKFYETYIKMHNPDFAINRETVTNMLASLGKKNHLANNLEVTISPLTDLTENHLTLKSGKPVKSTIHITFGALTDNSLYGLIYDLQHQLPGIVLVSELKISRAGDISQNDLIAAMKQHIITPVVSGEISLIWIGIHSSDMPENGSR